MREESHSRPHHPRYLVFRGYVPVPRVAAPRPGSLTLRVFVWREVTLLFTAGEKSGCSSQAAASSDYQQPPCSLRPATQISGRGTCGHGCITARGGFEPRHSEERLREVSVAIATDPV